MVPTGTTAPFLGSCLLEPFPVLYGRIPRGFPEALEKIVVSVEGKGVRNGPYRHVGGFQQELGTLNFGKADVTADRQVFNVK